MGKKVARFLLIYCFGWLGSFIVNHSSLKPQGWKSRTAAYFWLGFLTLGLYTAIASISNVSFDPNDTENIGYFKD